MFEEIETATLKGYAVWEPILRTDDARAARRATRILQDLRVRHYWAGGQEVGEMFQGAIGLKGEPAWDVYLVYPPGIEWKGENPPKPAFFMHQLAGRLPEDRLLDAEKLAANLRAIAGRGGLPR